MLYSPLLFICLGSIFGCLILHFCDNLLVIQDLILIYTIVILSLIFIYSLSFFLKKFKYSLLSKYLQSSAHYHILLTLITSIIFFSYTNYQSSIKLKSRLEITNYNKTYNLNIKITKLPIIREHAVQLQADVVDKNINIKNIYINLYNTTITNFKVGQIWNMDIKLKPPYSMQNPYTFDYEFYLFHQGIDAVGTAKQVKLIQQNNFFDTTIIEQIRDNIQNKIQPLLKNLEYENILTALGLGNQSQITTKQWKFFNNTGIGHLISISGLHISIIALIASYFPLIFIRIYPRILFYINKRLICNSFGLLISGFYTLISGMQLPAQRTWLMLFIIFLLYRKINLFSSLYLAAIIILIFDPWSVGTASFWLSFIAVGFLIYLGQKSYSLTSYKSKIWYLSIKSQLAISLIMLPVGIFIFGQFSLISPLANAVAIPIVSYITTPLVILGIIFSFILAPISKLFFIMANFSFKIVMLWCNQLIDLPNAFGYSAKPNIWIVLICIIGILYLLLNFKWRWYGIILFLPLFMHSNNKNSIGDLKAIFLDVGQGSSILLSSTNSNILFDTAGAFGNSVMADKTIIPSLQGLGINIIDKLIITHADKDHSGGINSILNNFKVNSIITSMDKNDAILNLANTKNIPIYPCNPQVWETDNIQYAILFPLLNHDFNVKPNFNSCVLKVTTANTSILLTGDIEQGQEQILVDTYSDLLKSDILLSPHHGSKTSSTMDFLHAVQPENIIIQNGFLNNYKHPHNITLEKYNSIKTNIFRTDKLGAITVDTRQDHYKIDFERKRYWRNIY